MEFKKLNLRTVILLMCAGLMLFATVIIRSASHASMPEQSLQNPPVESKQNLSVVPAIIDSQMKGLLPEDVQSLKDMREQMDNDRLQQKKIKMLKLQLEQTNLQLEQEKSLSEINKLEKGNAGVVNDSNDQGQDKYPDVKVLYIGGTGEKMEAILSINGNNYSVKVKNKPVKNLQVLAITDMAVTIHFNLPQDLKETVEYKPE